MKKVLLCALCLLLAAGAGALGCWLVLRESRSGEELSVFTSEDVPATNRQLAALALDIASLLKTGDYARLAEVVHPEGGLVISPNATVSLEANQRFTRAEVAAFGKNTETYIWGRLSAESPSLISLTVKDYFSKYVFDHDYTCASLVGINHTARTGNSQETVTDAFPGAQFVDLCCLGAGENEDTGWSILRLVFEDYHGQLVLSAIIHSEYTI